MVATRVLGKVINASGYRFMPLYDTYALREQFLEYCVLIGLKGTVVLSPEGINIGVSGSRTVMDKFYAFLRQHPRFASITFKESVSETTSFKKMLVKLKKQLVPTEDLSIDPLQLNAPHLPPQEFKKWLDEGRAVTVLDTRNTYEVLEGTFENAIHLELDQFREFETALAQLPSELREKPLVMFCTGGIRCEKASPIAIKAGFKEVYQLEGGILKYFEECGSAHYAGDCFVFDERRAVDTALKSVAESKH